MDESSDYEDYEDDYEDDEGDGGSVDDDGNEIMGRHNSIMKAATASNGPVVPGDIALAAAAAGAPSLHLMNNSTKPMTGNNKRNKICQKAMVHQVRPARCRSHRSFLIFKMETEPSSGAELATRCSVPFNRTSIRHP